MEALLQDRRLLIGAGVLLVAVALVVILAVGRNKKKRRQLDAAGQAGENSEQSGLGGAIFISHPSFEENSALGPSTGLPEDETTTGTPRRNDYDSEKTGSGFRHSQSDEEKTGNPYHDVQESSGDFVEAAAAGQTRPAGEEKTINPYASLGSEEKTINPYARKPEVYDVTLHIEETELEGGASWQPYDRKLSVPEGKHSTIGRSPEATLVLRPKYISRFHLKLEGVRQGLMICKTRREEDKNYTFLNGQPMEEDAAYELHEGDQVRIYGTCLTFTGIQTRNPSGAAYGR